MSTALLTWTIQPQQDILFLQLKDPLVRYNQYIETLKKYITLSDFTNIVFCENSWYPIGDKEILMKLAEQHWKKLEIVQYTGNHAKAVQKGRWYGESEIIEYAIKHSELIQNEWSFIKITWRYWCANINSIIAKTEGGNDTYFSKLMPISLFKLDTKAINTALFKTTVAFFNTHLAWAGEEVDDTHIVFLEHVYYKRLMKVKNLIHSLPHYPKMRGRTWEWTELKKSSLVELVMQIVHKLWITKL